MMARKRRVVFEMETRVRGGEGEKEEKRSEKGKHGGAVEKRRRGREEETRVR